MAVSPRSTVSSDLYSPSEPEQSNAHVHGGSIQIGEHHSAFEDGNAEADGSDYSDTMQGLDSAGEDVSSPSSAAAGPILGVSSETTHKRKREDYVQDEASPEQYRGLKYQEGGPLTPNNESFGATNRSPFQWQDDGTIDDPSRMKRPKPNGKPLVSTKETTLSCKFSALPAAVWQHVFCFVPPVFLGRLLRVNHAFNSYLTTDEKIEDVVPLTHSIIQPLTADAIWVASRRRFAPGLPRPIRGLRELDMWRLLVGRNCQICGHVKDADPATFSESPWEAGPGESGVRIVWPFGVRCCGSCLQDISKKVLIKA